MNRRKFVFQSSSYAIATFIAANASVYVIGSAFKSLDGNIVAGAKSCGPAPSAPSPLSCPPGANFRCAHTECNTTTGTWINHAWCERPVMLDQCVDDPAGDTTF